MNNLLSKPVYNYLNLYVGDLDLYLGGSWVKGNYVMFWSFKRMWVLEASQDKGVIQE